MEEGEVEDPAAAEIIDTTEAKRPRRWEAASSADPRHEQQRPWHDQYDQRGDYGRYAYENERRRDARYADYGAERWRDYRRPDYRDDYPPPPPYDDRYGPPPPRYAPPPYDDRYERYGPPPPRYAPPRHDDRYHDERYHDERHPEERAPELS